MTEDQLTRDMMAATASAYNCTGGNNGDLPTNMALSDFDEVTSALLSNDAFGTGPTRNAFLGLGHTDLSKDFNNLAGFLPKWNYPFLTIGI